MISSIEPSEWSLLQKCSILGKAFRIRIADLPNSRVGEWGHPKLWARRCTTLPIAHSRAHTHTHTHPKIREIRGEEAKQTTEFASARSSLSNHGRTRSESIEGERERGKQATGRPGQAACLLLFFSLLFIPPGRNCFFARPTPRRTALSCDGFSSQQRDQPKTWSSSGSLHVSKHFDFTSLWSSLFLKFSNEFDYHGYFPRYPRYSISTMTMMNWNIQS